MCREQLGRRTRNFYENSQIKNQTQKIEDKWLCQKGMKRRKWEVNYYSCKVSRGKMDDKRVWSAWCTAKTLRLLITSGCTKVARGEYEVECDKAGRAVPSLICKEWSTGNTTIFQEKLDIIKGKLRNIFTFFKNQTLKNWLEKDKIFHWKYKKELC